MGEEQEPPLKPVGMGSLHVGRRFIFDGCGYA